MDFQMSEDQVMLYRVSREFAEKEVRPRAQELDKQPNPMDRIDWELIKKGSQLGFRTLTFPEEYGGVGADFLTTAIHYEALSWGDAAYSHYFFQIHALGPSIPLMRKEQIDKLVIPMSEDDTYLISVANSEGKGATEYVLPYDEPGAAFDCVAERKGDEYIINGTKLYSSNGPMAKMFMISVQTDKKAPLSRSWTQIMVPRDTPGLSLGKIHEHTGMRLLPTSELILDDVRVPTDHVLGEVGRALEQHHAVRPWILTIHNAQMLGILQALYDATLDYAKERVVCGKPIIEHDTIKVMLAEMRMKVEAGRGLVYKTAWSLDHQRENFQYNTEMVNLTKAFLDEIALTIMRNADEIHGGMGTNTDMEVEKLQRDCFTMLHWMNCRSISYLKGAPTVEARETSSRRLGI
jgi:alkylation response protein AidB-like acyl-CoA dehydrogenase